MNQRSKSLNDRAVRKNDFWALFILLWGLFFILRGETMEMTRPTGPAMYAVSAICFVIVVLLPVMLRAVLKRTPRGEDEYLRRLLGVSAACGFYLAVAVFVVWVPLSGTLVPDLTAPQLLGLMLLGSSFGWFGMRWRDAH